ncbi:hypothetical protein MNBD_ALPHA04-1029 [hydrothermal vent metagenome]|uniref:EcxA zinc-binding domain-containing protein n=1 Tax=hydrothermal vent metagenome TaxID=652676 RepID=A0A3B0R6I8_9ZZZZ
MVEKLAMPGESWDAVLRGHKLLLGIYRQHVNTISRYIGGIYVDRTFVGQATASAAPLVPVPLEQQKYAMAMLAKHVFAPGALTIPGNLLSHLQAQRRGFSGAKAPLVRLDVGKVQQSALSHLLHVTTLRRIVDSGFYGNEYDVHAVLGDLTSAIFDVDLRISVNSYRKDLQVSYVEQLIMAFNGDAKDNVALSSIYAQITHIDRLMARSSKSADAATKAHRRYIRQLIEAALAKH